MCAVQSTKLVKPGINLVKHVALFEERHIVPEWVKDHIFDKRPGGWDTLDIWEFQKVALEKFLRWQYDGVKTVYIYLSGLTTAVVSTINAAHKLGIYVKLFHYSYIINKWLPQTVECLTPPPGISHALTAAEIKDWERDRKAKSEMTDSEYGDFRFYVKAYLDLRDKYKDTVCCDWGFVRSGLQKSIKFPRMDYIELMRPFLCPLNTQEMIDIRDKGMSYNEELRHYILQQRAPGSTYPSTQRQTKTQGGEQYGGNQQYHNYQQGNYNAFKGGNYTGEGYCSRPAHKKYKNKRKH